ncbi:MAG: hypothetical protein LJE91_08255, partial [Gammaproteobacteria bacterium]|nr:hypothetical protein [Gammaproteobacteria bacterium]
MTALDELSGVGGEELADSGLVPRVEGIYKRYFTLNRGSETGELQKARVEAEKAKSGDGEARAQLGELEEQIEKYERLQQDVTRLEEQGSAAKIEESRRAEALRAFESVRQRVDKAQTAHALAETAQTKARGAAEARATLKDQAAESAKALEAAKTQLTEITAAFTRMKSAYDDAEAAVKGAEREEREAGAHLTAARNRVEYLEARERRARLAGRIERIEALQRQIDAADAAVRANPVDDARIGRVRQADRTRREAAAALHAGAPEVAIDALQRIETRVNEETVGLSAGDHRDFRAAEAFRFELPDVLRLRVRPGASFAALQLARAETEKEIERLLRECGADSVERAERRARERARAREDSKTAN